MSTSPALQSSTVNDFLAAFESWLLNKIAHSTTFWAGQYKNMAPALQSSTVNDFLAAFESWLLNKIAHSTIFWAGQYKNMAPALQSSTVNDFLAAFWLSAELVNTKQGYLGQGDGSPVPIKIRAGGTEEPSPCPGKGY